MVALATFTASLIPAILSLRSAREARTQAKQATKQAKKTQKMKLEADESLQAARLAYEVSRRLAGFRVREFDKLKEDVAIFWAAIECARETPGNTPDQQRAALEAAKRISLSFRPDAPFRHDLNDQLRCGTEEIFGRSTPKSREAIVKLGLSLWKLVDEEDKRKLSALRGEKHEPADLDL